MAHNASPYALSSIAISSEITKRARIPNTAPHANAQPWLQHNLSLRPLQHLPYMAPYGPYALYAPYALYTPFPLHAFLLVVKGSPVEPSEPLMLFDIFRPCLQAPNALETIAG